MHITLSKKNGTKEREKSSRSFLKNESYRFRKESDKFYAIL